MKQIPYSFAKKNIVFPVKEEEGVVYIAISDPLHLEPLEELRHMLNSEVRAVYSPKEVILTAINDLIIASMAPPLK